MFEYAKILFSSFLDLSILLILLIFFFYISHLLYFPPSLVRLSTRIFPLPGLIDVAHCYTTDYASSVWFFRLFGVIILAKKILIINLIIK